MSELFNHLSQWPGLDEVCRVDPHFACVVETHHGRKFGLLVTDDSWNAWFVAQYHVLFSHEKVIQVGELIRGIGQRPGGHLFKFEHNDDNGMVRGIFQLPVANETRWEDDVRAAMSTLIEEWSTLLPFLDRVEAGEPATAMLDEAKQTFAAKNARSIRPLNRAG